MNPEFVLPRELREIICTTCPSSCHLEVWTDPETGATQVAGAGCLRGEEHGRAEYTHPVRLLTTTVRLLGGRLPLLPVRSRTAIPRARLLEALAILGGTAVRAPVKMGDVILSSIAGTGIDIIASRDCLSGGPVLNPE